MPNLFKVLWGHSRLVTCRQGKSQKEEKRVLRLEGKFCKLNAHGSACAVCDIMYFLDRYCLLYGMMAIVLSFHSLYIYQRLHVRKKCCSYYYNMTLKSKVKCTMLVFPCIAEDICNNK